MPSSDGYLAYVLDLLKNVEGITHRKMMGEYLLYKDGKLFGGIYDNRFLIKKTAYSSSLGLSEETPYDGAKAMFMVESENDEEIKEIIERTVSEL